MTKVYFFQIKKFIKTYFLEQRRNIYFRTCQTTGGARIFQKAHRTIKNILDKFFRKKTCSCKKNTDVTNDNNETNSPRHENESKMSTAVTTTKKKPATIGTYELGPMIGKF